jgi:hypothetical protein
MEYKVNLKPRYGYGLPPHPMLYDIINKNRPLYEEILHEAVRNSTIFQGFKKKNEETDIMQPVYNNEFLPGLDIIGIYTIIQKYKPETYIEVGSGYSTKVAYRAIKDNSLNTQIISIDPCPRAEIDRLANKIVRVPFENTNLDILFTLKENDILFIDNSHRILPNSDSLVFYLDVLPKLAKGVIVHIHDIYLPYDYPQFMCDRFYTEQYGLAIYMLANPQKIMPLLPNWFISQDSELSSKLKSVWDHPNLADIERHGGSFWFVIE